MADIEWIERAGGRTAAYDEEGNRLFALPGEDVPEEVVHAVQAVRNDRFIIVVKPEHRAGRGTYWRPNACGYTNDLAEAGLYTSAQVEARGGQDVSDAVPAEALIPDAIAGLEAQIAILREKLVIWEAHHG